MEFVKVAGTLEELESISSRRGMVERLEGLFSLAGYGEVKGICYLVLGKIAPDYKGITLDIGEEMAKSAIARAGKLEEENVEEAVKKQGDLGKVAEELLGERGEGLSLEEVHTELMRIARFGGQGSRENKISSLSSLLSRAGKKERRYIVRVALGQMRLGVGDMTVLDALAQAFLGSREKRSSLEHAYNISSDVGRVGEVAARSGLPGIRRMRISLGRPIRPMLAQRVPELSDIMEKIASEEISVEEKYDGERIQAHKEGERIKLFSRKLNEVSRQFPDVGEQVRGKVRAEKAILDGEVVAYDFENQVYYPFQRLMRRRRKYGVEDFAEKIPVKYMAFDLLYLDGSSLMRKSFPQRRKMLEEVLQSYRYIAPAQRVVSRELDEVEDFFQNCLEEGLEGIVCKSCARTSYYRAGARGWSWIKWKKEYASELSDTFDLVVVGAYSGRGKRAGLYGALLCASYNREEDVFQTLCKVGTGFSDRELEGLPKKLSELESEGKPTRVMSTSEVEPDFWFRPALVMEVIGSELTRSRVHTCAWEEGRGLGLRFPRFRRWRPEKGPEQATTTGEVEQMFRMQSG